jgi:DamX protein
MVAKNIDYFTTFELTQRLDLICHLIDNIEIIPIIRGPLGIGKSHFAARVRQLAPVNWSVCLFEAETSMSPDRLVTNIARSFGWSDMHGDLLEGLTTCCDSMRDEGQVPVLLIDDAQLLPPAALITLLRLFERQREGEPLISIVLFADEQIDLLLATPQLRIMTPQAIQIIDLPSFNREDATSYMRFLLKLEGLPADIELDDAKLTRLYRETKGIPGPLAQAILGAISGGNTMPMRGISNRSQRVFLGIVGILLLGGVIVYQDQINHLFQSPQSGEADKAAEAHSDQQYFLQPDDGSQADQPVPGTHEITEPATDEPMQLDVALGWDSGDLPGQMRSMIEPADPLTGIDGLESMEDVQESQGLQGDDGANDTQNSPESEMVEISGNALISTLPLEPKTAPESPEHTEIPKPDPIPEPVKASPSPAAIAVPQSPIDPLRREDWIKTRPAEHYTLQLLGVERLQALKDYVARYDLRSQAFYYITRRKGKPWHPLLWGDFPDKKSAIKGSKQLPLKVQNKGFWIRSFGELQAQLEKK